MSATSTSELCVFCHREGVKTRGHHIIPRCKGGRETVPACETCEDFIHSTWSHNELRDIYNNVETILASEPFQRFLKWLLKQQKTAVYPSARGNRRAKGKFR